MFASLCSLVISAEKQSPQRAARMPLDLVCRDGNADAGAADYDALFALAVCYRMGDRLAVNGIVAAILGVSAVVFVFKAARVEVLHDLLLERPAAVVGTNAIISL